MNIRAYVHTFAIPNSPSQPIQHADTNILKPRLKTDAPTTRKTGRAQPGGAPTALF